jgi:uncharacterized membrane protein
MAPLIILLATFGIFFAVNKFLLGEKLSLSFIGRYALAMMLIATGIAHFTNTDVMVQMLPEFMPAKREIVYFTGVCELLAVVLLWDKTLKLTTIMLIVFFIAILPANIFESLKEGPIWQNRIWRDIYVFPNSFADFVYRLDLLFRHKVE